MTFGRSDAEFWRMTPAKLHALMDVHTDVHSDSGDKSRRQVSKDPAADLAMLGAI